MNWFTRLVDQTGKPNIYKILLITRFSKLKSVKILTIKLVIL